MKITFSINYYTYNGETLSIRTTQQRKGKPYTTDHAMTSPDNHRWEAEINTSSPHFSYYYLVKKDDKVIREEWRGTTRYVTTDEACRLNMHDAWKDIPADSYYYASAFTEAFARRPLSTTPISYANKTVLLRVTATRLRSNERLAVLGNQEALHNWDTQRAIQLEEVQPNEWQLVLDAETLTTPMIYKFLVIDNRTGQTVRWEERDNRTLNLPLLTDREAMAINVEPVRLSTEDWKGAGCVIPVFSLRTQQSFGVGDFGDLKQMIDWIAMTGQRVLQILPINDTTMTGSWTDSYPYNSISIYALHPQYICLSALPPLQNAKKAKEFENIRVRLNALSKIDYEAVHKAKQAYLRLLYAQEGATIMQRTDYQEFKKENEEWLLPYAAFSHLRDTFGTPDFHTWPNYRSYNKAAIARLYQKSGKEIDYYIFLQYILHIQLLEASRYARSKGVVIKGDIPIGISRNSVEAWVEPHYFNMNGQAGAPPDAFSTNGQNWGFPTYNWDVMAKDGCQWWVKRFRKMAVYFDAYRIDHVLGFFRIWEIPLHAVHGLLGQFSPALPMSEAEIEGYGLPFHREEYTQPHINDIVITSTFGEQAQYVKQTFLTKQPIGYKLKREFDTQRKVETYFKNREDAVSVKIRDGLYSLISDVLFVVDRKDPHGYHPRIAAQFSHSYQALHFEHKMAFDRLYNDYYYSRHNQFWYNEAMKKLPLLTAATRMLVCAEDLGMVPECVPWAMKDLRILTLEIQSMSKSPYHEFARLNENPYCSVATISTHDMATLRGWWDEDPGRTQRYYNQSLSHQGTAPHPAPGQLCEEIITAHLACPSMLCLLSWQDWLSMDESLRNPDTASERINIPANPRNYWQYRMHISIEQLMTSSSLNKKIHSLIEENGRG